MNYLFKPLTYLFLLSIVFFSCDKEKEAIPSYIRISNFSLSTNPGVQGLNTQDIVSAKIFVNGTEIGNFELPALVPVLKTGLSYVEIYPNIKENGSSNSQKYFKPYNGYMDTIDLQEGKVIQVNPQVTYRSNTKFRWIEDFEDQGISLQTSGLNNTNDSLVIVPTSTAGVDQPFSGSDYCAYVKCTSDSFVIFERSNTEIFNNLPFLGTDIYVELDIKTNVSFQVGIYTDDGNTVSQIPVMVINPTEGKWKKIYVNLKSETGGLTAGTSVKLFFGFYKEAGDTVDKEVYLDNLKLVYLE
jgi:hypothetical protein